MSDTRVFKFGFKETKIKENGKVIGKNPAHPSFEATLPVPTVAYVSDIMARFDSAKDGMSEAERKVGEMLTDAIHDIVFQSARNQINDWLDNAANGGKNFTPENFDISKLTLEAIASIPKGQRGAWAPSDEELADFCEDYTAVMCGDPDINYPEKRVQVHCDLFKKGLTRIKLDKEALAKMGDFLTLWASKKTEESMSDFFPTYEWLTNKITKYMNAEERNFASVL